MVNSYHISYIYVIICEPNFSSPVSWGYRIHQVHLCRGVRPPPKYPGYDTKQSNDEASVTLELWGM